MLVLTRKVGEEIVIDGKIRILVADIENGRVKIGVIAHRQVKNVRAELDAKPMIVTTEKKEAQANVDLERILANRSRTLTPHLEAARERAQHYAPWVLKPR